LIFITSPPNADLYYGFNSIILNLVQFVKNNLKKRLNLIQSCVIIGTKEVCIMLMDCGANIKEARNGAHLTQEQLAKAIGKSESTIQKYELGLAEPPLSALKAISDSTGVSVGFLIYGPRFILFGDGTTKPTTQQIGEAYEKATPAVQRIVDVALEPFMIKAGGKDAS
jgi:transcriptional regulator with XRE-family HTH domain